MIDKLARINAPFRLTGYIKGLVANGMTSEPLITTVGLAYLVLIEVLGTIVGAYVLGVFCRRKNLDISWEVRTVAMATAMIVS